MDIVQITFYAGVVLGAALILSVCWVYVRKRSAGTGEIAFCMFGVVLTGLSIWSRVSIEAGSLRLELDRLAEQQQRVEEVVRKTVSAVDANSQTLSEVTLLAARAVSQPPPESLNQAIALQRSEIERLGLAAQALAVREPPQR